MLIFFIVFISNTSIGNVELSIYIYLSALAIPFYCLLYVRERRKYQFNSKIRTSIFWFFVFFYVCFYHLRAIYIVANEDLKLINTLDILHTNYHILLAILYFSLVLNLFIFVGLKTRKKSYLVNYLEKSLKSLLNKLSSASTNRLDVQNHRTRGGQISTSTSENSKIRILILILLQFISTLPIIMLANSIAGKLTALTDSAYVYLFPVITYGFDLYIFSSFFAIKTKSKSTKFVILIISFSLILLKSIAMRELSSFRSVAFCLIISIFIGIISKKTNNFSLIIVYLLILPLLSFFGQSRYEKNTDLLTSINSIFSSDFLHGYVDSILQSFSSSGDYAAFDLLVSVLSHKQEFYPLGLSFLYIPFHLIPRSIWPSKPLFGSVTDDSFTMSYQHGQFIQIPYTPGIVGQYYLEGGIIFLFVLILITAYFIRSLDYAFENIFESESSESPLFIYGLFFFYTSSYVRMVPYQYFYSLSTVLVGYYVFGKLDMFLTKKQKI